MAVILGVRGIIYGFGYGTADPLYTKSRLWELLLQSPISPELFGWVVMSLSIAMVAAFIVGKDRWVQIAGYTNILSYMFIGMAYVAGTEFTAAYTQGFMFVLAIGFLTYTYLNRYTWIDPEQPG